MSIKNDLGLAYHMGYDDALAKRKPDASKTQILASDDLAEENSKLRELVRDVWHLFTEHGAVHPYDLPKVDAVRDRMHELEVEVES